MYICMYIYIYIYIYCLIYLYIRQDGEAAKRGDGRRPRRTGQPPRRETARTLAAKGSVNLTCHMIL